MKITCFLTVVEIDLTAAHFRPGKPNCYRVKWSLSERLGEDVDFIMCHSPSGTPYPYPSRCNAIVTVVVTCHDSSVGRESVRLKISLNQSCFWEFFSYSYFFHDCIVHLIMY